MDRIQGGFVTRIYYFEAGIRRPTQGAEEYPGPPRWGLRKLERLLRHVVIRQRNLQRDVRSGADQPVSEGLQPQAIPQGVAALDGK